MDLNATPAGQMLGKLQTLLKEESTKIQNKTNELTKLEVDANAKQKKLLDLKRQVQTAEMEVTAVLLKAKAITEEISGLKNERSKNELEVKKTLAEMQRLSKVVKK